MLLRQHRDLQIPSFHSVIPSTNSCSPPNNEGKFQRLAWRLISNNTTQGIWLLMNKIVFEKKTISLFDCFSFIFYRVAIQLHILNPNFTYTGNNQLRSFDGIKLWCNKKFQVVFLFQLQQINFFILFFSKSISFFSFMSLYFILTISIISIIAFFNISR